MAKFNWLLAATAGSLGLLAACSTSVNTAVQSSSPNPIQDLRASVFSSSSQAHSTVASGPDGRLMVAWDSRRQEGGTYGVFARCFDAAGNPLSHEIHVNATVPSMQHKPSVTFAADGSAWFAWESFGQDGSGASVVARQFALQSGEYVPVGGEIPVNIQRQDDQCSPVIASTSQGAVVAVFANQLPTDETGLARFELHSRRLNSAGSAAEGANVANSAAPNGEHILSQPGVGSDSLPCLTALADGRFLVTWARSHAEHQNGIWARHLAADGSALGEEFRLSQNPTAIEPSLDAQDSGAFVAAWLVQSGEGYAVQCARFDAVGNLLSEETLATPEDGWKSGVSVASAADGRYLVAYNNEDPTAKNGDIQVHRFYADGMLHSISRGSSAIEGRQSLTVATGVRRTVWTDEGPIAFAWDGDAGLGDSSAVHLTLRAAQNGNSFANSTNGMATASTLGLGEPQAAIVDIDSETLAANPPIWDPNWQPQERLMLPATSGDFGFEAISGTGWTPPDPEMAIGPDRIMVIVNGRIACFDRNGTEQWGTAIEGNSGFWNGFGTGGFVFDPETCWDPHAERFVAMACERTGGRSYFLLAVSKDNSPGDTNDWHKYRMDVTAIAGGDIDSPNLSVSTNTILLTADFFSPDKYILYLVDKASVLGGGTAVTTSELITGTHQQSMGIPVVYDNTDTLYIAQTTENSNNTSVILHAITNPFTAYNRVTQTVAVEPYTYPAHPPQKGTTSKPYLFEPRFWSCAQRNGSIWAVHHVNNQRSRARWYQFELNGWPSTGTPAVRQWGEINLGGGIYSFFPSIAVDGQDNAAITFARSASNEYISIGRAVRAAGDPLGEFRPAQVVKTSANSHTSGRWGDYSGTQPDPLADGTFWGHHEFVVGGWRTWVARYDLLPAPLMLTETTLTAGTTAAFDVTGATVGQRVYFLYSLTGKGLHEEPLLSTTFSLENPILIGFDKAVGGGIATVNKFVPNAAQGMDVWLQAAEFGRTSNWYKVTIQ